MCQKMSQIIDRLDFIKIKKKKKNFWSEEDYHKRIKRQASDWRKNNVKTHLIKDYYPTYIKNS